MPSSKKASSPAPRSRRRAPAARKPAARKPAARRKRTAVARRAPAKPAKIVVLTPLDPLAATQPVFALSTVATAELEAFATVLHSCKRAVATFTDDQREKLRTILGRAHRALKDL